MRIAAMRSVLAACLGLAGLAWPALVLADSSPGCRVIGSSTSAGAIDLSAQSVWHVQSTDHVAVTATTATSQTQFEVSLSALGFEVPIGSGDAGGVTTMDWAEYEMADFAYLGRTFVVSGSSSGPQGSCEAEFTVIVDDVNPWTTALGGGSAGVALIGVLGSTFAARNARSGVRRGLGLISFAASVAAATVLMQQTWDPEAAPTGVDVSTFASSVPGLAQVSVEPVTLGIIGALAVGLMILMPFPSQLFNSTLEQNLDRIRDGLRRLPLVGGLVSRADGAARPAGLGRALVIGLFVAISGVLYALLDPDFSLDLSGLLLWAGLVVSMLAVTWVAELPRRSAQKAEIGDPGWLRAVPATLLIGAVCVLISRLSGFLPGYLYGLILGYQFGRELDREAKGRALASGAWWLLLLSLTSWVLLGAVRGVGVAGTLPGIIAETFLTAFVVAGIEGIVFALTPVRFLPGEYVFAAGRFRWAILYAVGAFAFVWIILNPANGFIGVDGQASFVTAAALFVAFALVSVLFWAWFRLRRSPTAAG